MSQPIPSTSPRRCSIGIDVAKDSFQAASCPGTDNISFAYDPAGIKALLDWLNGFSVQLIVLEATGGYHRRLVTALTAAGHPLVVANPRQVRDFAKARGVLAKSDPIDARVIADFACTIRPTVRPLAAPEQQHLKDLVARRNQLVSMHTQEQNRSQQTLDKDLARSLKRSLVQLQREIRKIEALIEKALAACPAISAKAAELDKSKGLGKTASVALAAALPEIGELTGRQITALAGLAPFDFDSGKYAGSRHIWGGRAAARQILYMISVTLLRWDEKIKAFHQNLLRRGKKKKVALTAVMRKVLIQLNARVRDALIAKQKQMA